MSYYDEDQDYDEDEYQELLSCCESRGISSTTELNSYIMENRPGRELRSLSNDHEYDSGYKVYGGISKDVYARLCRDLDINSRNYRRRR